MPKIKIVLVESRYCDDESSENIIREGITDWEEVSQADLNLLRSHVYRLSRRGRSAVIVEYYPDSTVEAVKSIKEWLATELAEEREKAKAAAKKKAEKERKKVTAKAERERKVFEDLRKKFEVEGKMPS